MTDTRAGTVIIALAAQQESQRLLGLLCQWDIDGIALADGAQALNEALRCSPSLVITEPALPVIDGRRLLKILRNNPNTEHTPFIFLADSPTDIDGFRPGTDLFVTRPFQWDELLSRAKQLIERARRAGGDKERRLQGELKQIPLVDLLQVFQFNQKEGELVLTRAAEQCGIIYIKDGHIYNATLGDIEGEKALYRLMGWKEGAFEFIPKPVRCSHHIKQSTPKLIMEGLRQIDELGGLKDRLPPESSLLRARVGAGKLPKGLKPVIYELLRLVECYPRLSELVDRSSFSDYEVYKTLISLIERGIIEVESSSADDSGHEFLPATLVVRVKECLARGWQDGAGSIRVGVVVAATSCELAREFLSACRRLGQFSPNRRLLVSDRAFLPSVLGELRLDGGLTIVLYCVPAAAELVPLVKTLSHTMVGLVLLWDDTTSGGLTALMEIRRGLAGDGSISTLYLYGGSSPLKGSRLSQIRELFALKDDEPIVPLFGRNTGVARVFKRLIERIGGL